MTNIRLVAALLSLAVVRTTAVESPAPSVCLYQPDKTVAIRPAPGRVVYCGLDLGSNTVKLSVISGEAGKGVTFSDERQCKRTLGMGKLVFDSTTSKAGPLPDASVTDLIETMREYQRICSLDGGTMVAAGATQWARDATNVPDVQKRVAAATGLNFSVLSPVQEAEYSDLSASLGSTGRIVLDPGSNSFELSWQERGASTISSVLVPYGYVRGSTNDFEPAADYRSGRLSYDARARAAIETALNALTPRMTIASLRARLEAGAIGPELVALGQDGAAVQLAVRGELRSGTGWISSAAGFNAVVARQKTTTDPSFGALTAPPIRLPEIDAFLMSISPADFKTLTTDPVRALYGQKALVVPALVDLLLRELGASRLVMVPQESTNGHVVAALAH